MSATECIQLMRLAQELERLSQSRASGTLILNSHAEEGKLFFYQGQLLYGISDIHRVRRWGRAVGKHCPNWKVQPPLSLFSVPTWEYNLLCEGVHQQSLRLAAAKTVICRVNLEVLFSLSRYIDLTYCWQPNETLEPNSDETLALSQGQVQTTLIQVHQLYSQWQAANLSNLSPNLSPILTKSRKSLSHSNITEYLNGQLTLWDIGLKLQKSLVSVTRALVPLVHRGLLKFQTLPDLPEPIEVTQKLPQDHLIQSDRQKPLIACIDDSPTDRQKPLIACIDDSPTAAQSLRKILEPLGCDVLSIENPIQGLAQIAKYKPDLIFLDLVMPNANGYIVCKFLRNAPIFQNTPVVILTNRDTIVDRNYSKIVGASDFLKKPSNPLEIQRVIWKYLGGNYPGLKPNPFEQDQSRSSELFLGSSRPLWNAQLI